MSRNQKIIYVLILMSLFPFLLFHGCGKGGGARDKNLEDILSKKLTEFRHGDEEYLDLRTVLRDPWEEICLQGPYLPKDDFGKAVICGRTEYFFSGFFLAVFHVSPLGLRMRAVFDRITNALMRCLEYASRLRISHRQLLCRYRAVSIIQCFFEKK